MIPELHDRWMDALLAAGPSRVHAEIEDRSREFGLCYGDRPVCRVLRPFFIRRRDYDDLQRRAALLVPAIGAAWRMVRADPDKLARLHLTPGELALIDAEGGAGLADLVGRLDSFPAADGTPRFLEYNGESPGGLAFGDKLGEVFAATAPFKAMASGLRLERVGVIDRVVETFLEAWRRRTGSKGLPGLTAIVDLPGMPTVGEFHLFRAAFERAGARARVIDDIDLQLVDGKLIAGEDKIDLVYRRLVTMDILSKCGGTHILADAARQGAACIANGFEGYGLCHKSLFAFLSDPSERPQDLTEEQVTAIDESIPWTRMVEPGRRTTPPDGGAEQSLERIALDARERLVLKPATGYGGKGIVLGWRTAAADWARAIEESTGTPAVLQARVDMSRSLWPVWHDGRVEEVELFYDLDPYRIGGVSHGVGVRLSGGEILNVATGAGSAVPAFLVDEEG